MGFFEKGSQWFAAALFSFAAAISRADEPAPLTPPQILTNGEARLLLGTPTNTSMRIEASTNLVNWVGMLTIGPGSLTHTDTFAPFVPGRFYRQTLLAAGELTGDNIPASGSDIVIHPVTHASFVMKWNGITIYNDPDTANYTAFPKADLILVGHEHNDHFDAPTITTQLKAGGKIIATQTIYNSLSATLKAATIVLTNGATTNVFGIQIDAIPAYNSNHPKGVGNGYVLTMGGKRIYMSGDTGDIPETRALQTIDVAFLCMNVPYTMTVNQAATVTRAFAPRIVYPYHYRNQDGTFANLNTFKSLVGKDLEIEVRFRKWY